MAGLGRLFRSGLYVLSPDRTLLVRSDGLGHGSAWLVWGEGLGLVVHGWSGLTVKVLVVHH